MILFLRSKTIALIVVLLKIKSILNVKTAEQGMTKTFHEVCEDLQTLDEITILEILEITSEELIEKFQDKIEDNFVKVVKALDNELEDYNNYE
jgi:uncharacterized protein YecA (UPF0149 family)